MGPLGPQGPMGPVAPIFMDLHVKCPLFSAKDDEDAESHLLQSNDWITPQNTAEEAKCGRIYLILGGDAHSFMV